jgi:hypothetical protein
MQFDTNITNDLPWRTSSFCSTGSCVEIAITTGPILVRDTKKPNQPPLMYTKEEWREFIAGAKGGEFDV